MLLDGQKQPIQTVIRESAYDPRSRPWYQESVQKGDLLISEPYLFSTKQVVGLTVAMPFYAPKKPHLAGVVAADVLISQISELLGQQPVSKNSISLVINADDQIIAYPDRDTQAPISAHVAGGVMVMQKLVDVLPLPVKSIPVVVDGVESQSDISGTYLIRVVSLTPMLDKPWQLVIVVPISDFIEPLNARNEQLLGAGLLAIALEAIIAYLVLNGIRAMHQREQQAQRETLVAKEQVLHHLRESEQRLELRVKERTLALLQANQQLETLSSTDALTGIWNRRKFEEILRQEWNRAARTKQSVSMAVIDVDWFKAYNDHYGHLAGDECLKAIASVLQDEACRAGDFCARVGGEEFVVMSCGGALPNIRVLAESIRKAVFSRQIPHAKSDFGVVTVSIGIAAIVPEKNSSAEVLYKQADTALYRAKDTCRNCVQA